MVDIYGWLWLSNKKKKVLKTLPEHQVPCYSQYMWLWWQHVRMSHLMNELVAESYHSHTRIEILERKKKKRDNKTTYYSIVDDALVDVVKLNIKKS